MPNILIITIAVNASHNVKEISIKAISTCFPPDQTKERGSNGQVSPPTNQAVVLWRTNKISSLQPHQQ